MHRISCKTPAWPLKISDRNHSRGTAKKVIWNIGYINQKNNL